MPAFNTPLTLLAVRNYVRNLMIERASDSLLGTDQELNDIINLSSRCVWLSIVTKYPDVLAQRSAASIAVTTGSVAFSAIVASGGGAGNVFRILNALVGPTGTAENAMEQIHEFDKVSARHVYEPGVGGTPTGLVAQPAIPYRWYVEGTTLFFTPQTTGSFDTRVQWVQQPQDMTGDTDTVWQGQLAMYHDAVVTLSASMVQNKTASMPNSADPVLQALDKSLEENFGPPRHPYHDQPRNPYAEIPKNARP
jgi:hypothetical protein